MKLNKMNIDKCEFYTNLETGDFMEKLFDFIDEHGCFTGSASVNCEEGHWLKDIKGSRSGRIKKHLKKVLTNNK